MYNSYMLCQILSGLCVLKILDLVLFLTELIKNDASGIISETVYLYFLSKHVTLVCFAESQQLLGDFPKLSTCPLPRSLITYQNSLS